MNEHNAEPAMVLVPIEPTPEMCAEAMEILLGQGDIYSRDGRIVIESITPKDLWRSMLRAAPKAAPVKPEAVPAMTEFCWLVELFEPGGNSMGCYHTGLTDISWRSRSTKDPHKARRYNSKEEAERAASELFSKAGVWRAVEHGFAALSTQEAVPPSTLGAPPSGSGSTLQPPSAASAAIPSAAWLLAEQVLHMDLVTARGIRARELARQVLNSDAAPLEGECADVLRDLASMLGAGGYNAPAVDAKVFREKILWGIKELERTAEVFARGMEAAKAGETEGLDPKGDSPVGEADAPKETGEAVPASPLTDEQIDAAWWSRGTELDGGNLAGGCTLEGWRRAVRWTERSLAASKDRS